MRAEKKLLLTNKAWAKEKVDLRSDYFSRMEHVQRPQFLWIGCSDSRVPAEEVTGASPGELFVHRNVANLVVHTDLNLISVLQFAVEVLEVEHIIVCGHYGCGGVKAAMSHKNLGIINKWLRNIKDVFKAHRQELEAITNEEQRLNRLVELNVKEQVHNIAATSIVQKAWKKSSRPHLHGWVYNLKNGLLGELLVLEPGAEIDPIYKYDFEES
ncbi:MAG TPA: carbonate dehydratase [Oligoflexia bacterium]|nr:carbonate dehydratase [Oligoflexia bacterium]HMP27833.1 carbonate dehydratase [Oligoflexia bacterium]